MNEHTLYRHKVHVHQPQNVNVRHKEELRASSFNERIAVMITKGFGTMTTLYILIAWMLGWMVLASAGIWIFKNDQWPFSFLLFLSNLVQLWALPVLAVGQSVLGRKQELQADEAYQTTMKSYHDVEQVATHLAAQDTAIIHLREALQSLQSLLVQMDEKLVQAFKEVGYRFDKIDEAQLASSQIGLNTLEMVEAKRKAGKKASTPKASQEDS